MNDFLSLPVNTIPWLVALSPVATLTAPREIRHSLGAHSHGGYALTATAHASGLDAFLRVVLRAVDDATTSIKFASYGRSSARNSSGELFGPRCSSGNSIMGIRSCTPPTRGGPRIRGWLMGPI